MLSTARDSTAVRSYPIFWLMLYDLEELWRSELWVGNLKFQRAIRNRLLDSKILQLLIHLVSQCNVFSSMNCVFSVKYFILQVLITPEAICSCYKDTMFYSEKYEY